ncbi:Uu.00g043660.m01.CDS01 [Anthostomella pinea]|uniref:Uu.00g043660.m01.CDS01 n=1 Tax=Anthostomella pinea TaxID=933095 RepID=A0AAI8YED3_9PEZI|nr:Uu.00g043660.m01.CDS01 [Anthostomella pinea]
MKFTNMLVLGTLANGKWHAPPPSGYLAACGRDYSIVIGDDSSTATLHAKGKNDAGAMQCNDLNLGDCYGNIDGKLEEQYNGHIESSCNNCSAEISFNLGAAKGSELWCWCDVEKA